MVGADGTAEGIVGHLGSHTSPVCGPVPSALGSARRMAQESLNNRPQTPSRAELTPRHGSFPSTCWSVVSGAGVADPDQRAAALERLCRTYWSPLHTYIRRRGHRPEDAEDLTQEFLARLCEKGWLEGVERNGSRFRSFLLHALNSFLANQYDRVRAIKRGGGTERLPLDMAAADHTSAADLASQATPEQAYDRRWALVVLANALNRLKQEAVAAGKGPQFEVLNPFLSREVEPGDYASVAARLGVSTGAAGVSVHRLRHRYRECVRAEIAETVSDPGLVEEEMTALFAALRG